MANTVTTMSNILEQYKIKFSTSRNYGTLNRIQSIDELMTQFIGDHYRISEVDGLLAGINRVINGDVNECEDYTQSLIIAVITPFHVKIYEDLDEYENNNSIEPRFTIPLLDFKLIVEAWRSYLNYSTLNSPI
ncbi:hypothetical protein [Mucilaginibacter psychrotolerans]|uniref:Uncharacterized protein n=1 Tax=Mucilaginibacter psychrotolerans TaxID=1524096 RepID=A0A4Y8SIH9_9SPHI|nr:hypothetical protein [Mucilaginibacter psychrotolerans]TFF38839.1 hypothetical protein E2R66_07495 [Mucilaginibacter psychrotolerans]